MLDSPQMVKKLIQVCEDWNELQIPKLNLFELVRPKPKTFI